MIETGNLSNFNRSKGSKTSQSNEDSIVSMLNSNRERFPKIYSLLSNTTEFYNEHFYDLHKHIKREKRLVVFETPSRAFITHEYTIEDSNTLPQDFHFLFNTNERLNWLKIFLEGERISIASRDKVIQLLISKLGSELDELAVALNISSKEAATRLYDASNGKPCFIELNRNKHQGKQSLLLSINFFDSIRNKKTHLKKRLWSPLQEKQLTYNYSTISGNANAWLYVKSPANFNISIDTSATKRECEEVRSNDDEIKSFVLTPNGERLSVDFIISINVPQALKVWYITMFYLALTGLLLGCLLHTVTSPSISSFIEVYNNCCYAIIAAIIATRGWLMAEEQVMKNISNLYTAIICGLIAMIISLSIASHLETNNTNAPQSLPMQTRNEPPSMIKDSLGDEIYKTNEIIDYSEKAELKLYDSLQIQKPM